MDADGRWQILRLHVEDKIPLAALARDSGIGLRTLERWHARYRAAGLEALRSRPRADAGGHHLPAELVTLIEGLGLTKPRPSIATIHRTLAKVCAAERWPVPSYSVVWSIIRSLDPGMVTLALEGAASYRDKYELALRRAADRPNAMWQADHTLLDVLIVGADGKPARPWLTAVMDDCSRAVCGYTVSLDAPSSMHTALALRQAIWHKPDPAWPMCGIPDVLYVDHGSDFTSDHLTRTAVDLHIRLIHSAVARPQGRGKIERFFGTVNTELLAALPGHITGARPRPAPRLSLTELDTAVGTFVADYNDRPHSELGASPRSTWIADGWLPRMPDSLEDLDGLLLTVARPRTVRRDGIHFQGLRYVSPTLAGFVGRAVVIRYDPRDITEIRVFDHDEFVCKAVDQDHHGEQVSLKEVQAARNARRRTLRRGINERIAVVNAHATDPPPRPLPTRVPPPAKLKLYKEDLS
ncbi:Mu transposase C-terminal domain-containing protein [Cellulomonas fimi]|uniref:DDE-type integrase/transposase/recombinase n=1 Tax=Cellulomonas fimi TaxID=1708 RepID=A0A7Y0QGF8_CELFI|nr:Mu transposase C-terminal domain-containing protein [Cellulomonas fimi]NMR20086.1 DDE-type integrase/transposase/recombinase [Cellulomonas fimi]